MISMVILNYNDWQLTQDYAKRISLFHIIDHIVIVDNCSTDDSYEHLIKLVCNNIVVIRTTENGGYAKGNNFGVQYIINQYGKDGIVIISNPDIEVEEQSIVELTNILINNKELFAATGLIYDINNNIIPIFTWKLPTMPMLFVNSCTILRNILFKVFNYGTRIKINSLDFNQAFITCDALPGCFFAADLEKWIEIGGFCEQTFLFYEEDILFTKSKEIGYKVALVPSAKIKHFEGASIKKSLGSWKRRELTLQTSCIIYIKEALHKDTFIIPIYKFWNLFWLPERFFFFAIKANHNSVKNNRVPKNINEECK